MPPTHEFIYTYPIIYHNSPYYGVLTPYILLLHTSTSAYNPHGIKSKQRKTNHFLIDNVCKLMLIKYEDLLLTQELEPSHHPAYAANELHILLLDSHSFRVDRGHVSHYNIH